MKKSIIIGSLALFCNTLYSTITKYLDHGFGQGWLEYNNISNENKQSFKLVVMLDMMMKPNHGIVFASDLKEYAGGKVVYYGWKCLLSSINADTYTKWSRGMVSLFK